MSADWASLYRALLDARNKNLIEEGKLLQRLKQLEQQRLEADRNHFNNIFLQKRAAHQCKQQVWELQMKKHKEIRQLERTPSDNWIWRKPSIPIYEEIDNMQRKQYLRKSRFNAKAHQEPKPVLEDVKVSDTGLKGPSGSTLSSSGDHFLPDIQKHGYLQKCTTQITRTKRPTSLLSPGLLPTLGRSKTLPEHLQKQIGEEDLDEWLVTGVIMLPRKWVGEPEEIGSVRRQRKNPEELAKRRHVMGQLRQVVKNMADIPTCSKNCHLQVGYSVSN